MDNMEYQEVVFGLIVNAGNARSKAMNSIRLAKKGKIEEAKENLKLSEEDLNLAHEIQTKLIQGEAAGEKTELSLLMVHTQDHLMNAITVKDLANEIIEIHEKLIVD